MILNFKEKRAYVGESADVVKRLNTHRNALRNGSHYSRKMQHDWDRIGVSGFEFMILDTHYPWWQGPIREQFWIDVMRSLLSYNSIPVGQRKTLIQSRKREGLPYSIDFPTLRNVPAFDWKTKTATA